MGGTADGIKVTNGANVLLDFSDAAAKKGRILHLVLWHMEAFLWKPTFGCLKEIVYTSWQCSAFWGSIGISIKHAVKKHWINSDFPMCLAVQKHCIAFWQCIAQWCVIHCQKFKS